MPSLAMKSMFEKGMEGMEVDVIHCVDYVMNMHCLPIVTEVTLEATPNQIWNCFSSVVGSENASIYVSLGAHSPFSGTWFTLKHVV